MIQSSIPNAKNSANDPITWSYQTKELIDTFPKVWTRGLLYYLATFTTIALPWAMFSKVDETGTAKGRLEPTERTFILDAPVAGKVVEIKVEVGQKVYEGDILVELDSELVNTELKKAEDQLDGQKERIEQLEILKQQLLLVVDTQERENKERELEKQFQVQQAKQQLHFLQNSYILQEEEKLAQVNQAKVNVDYSKAILNSTQIKLNLANQEFQRYSKAFNENLVPEIEVIIQENVLAEEQQRYEQAKSEFEQARLRLKEQDNSRNKSLNQVKSNIRQAELKVQEKDKSYQTMIHTGNLALLRSKEQVKNIETEITSIEAEIEKTKSEIKSWKLQLEQRSIKAPQNGTIFDLSIGKPGKVLQPGELIAEIAPEDASFVVRAQIATSESGFLKKDKEKEKIVKLKFDAYPFQDYGIVEGTLKKISPTSKITDTPQGKVASYELEIELDQDCATRAKQSIPCDFGDTVTADVIVNQRRVIDYVLDPLKKLKEGGLQS